MGPVRELEEDRECFRCMGLVSTSSVICVSIVVGSCACATQTAGRDSNN